MAAGPINVDENGLYAPGRDVGMPRFPQDGRHTSGDGELDAQLRGIAKSRFKDSNTPVQSLRITYGIYRRKLRLPRQHPWLLFLKITGKDSRVFLLLCAEVIPAPGLFRVVQSLLPGLGVPRLVRDHRKRRQLHLRPRPGVPVLQTGGPELEALHGALYADALPPARAGHHLPLARP